MHFGTDLAAPLGTPVLAAYPGAVAVANTLEGYGLTIILRHESGTQESRYAHLSQVFVETGDWVEQGAIIGAVGSSGYSTGPHLHFEWRHLTQSGWVAVDAGLHLEYALENLMRSVQQAQAPTHSGG
ncbi:MAG: M23 family metallopeptidase [Chloroflexaceae bacterium]|nr:M23 family metallopeptidase [Chloroflexaceae bacterium]